MASKLAGTLMIGADLRGANLRSTDLRIVDLSDAMLVGAYADSDTKWPAGLSPKTAGISSGD